MENKITTKEIIPLLRGVKKVGDGWMALCPAHDDHNPSLSITQKPNGKFLMNCHAGCSFEAVLNALGFAYDRTNVRREADKSNESNGTNRSHGTHTTHKSHETYYTYHNPNGDEVFQTVRLEPKSFRARRPDGNGGWIWNLEGVTLYPYRVVELEAVSKLGERVYIVEGEKDCDALDALGLCATCNPLGAGKWKDDYSKYLVGAKAVIIPDNDKTGKAHAKIVAYSLKGIAAEVRILELPGLKEKGDVSDWLAAGGAKEELEAMASSLLREAGSDLTPVPPVSEATNKDMTHHEDCLVASFDVMDLFDEPDDVELASLPLLGVDGYFMEGWSHILSGYPKAGKTTLMFECAKSWVEEGAPVLWLSEEGKNIWKQRIKLAGAIPRGLRVIPALGMKPDVLLKVAGGSSEQVVIIDTVRNLFGLKDECDNSQISQAMGKWEAGLHEKTRIYTHHQRKGGGDHGEGIAGGGALLGCVDRALELKFDSHSNKRRTITVHSRLVEAPELLLEMTDEGLKALGEAEGVTLDNVQKRVYELLGDKWLSIKEIEGLLEKPVPSCNQIREALSSLYANGEIERNPRETKTGSTYKYRLITETSSGCLTLN